MATDSHAIIFSNEAEGDIGVFESGKDVEILKTKHKKCLVCGVGELVLSTEEFVIDPSQLR